jgi:hypothetical protein
MNAIGSIGYPPQPPSPQTPPSVKPPDQDGFDNHKGPATTAATTAAQSTTPPQRPLYVTA